jgi:uncharacterized protein (DUF952 family)
MMTELDLKDGFVHMSTAKQVPGVLKRFFDNVPSVAILRMDYARLSSFKRVSWDQTSSGESESTECSEAEAGGRRAQRCRQQVAAL